MTDDDHGVKSILRMKNLNVQAHTSSKIQIGELQATTVGTISLHKSRKCFCKKVNAERYHHTMNLKKSENENEKIRISQRRIHFCAK